MVSKEEFQGWILDYACYHRIPSIIRAISLRHAGRLDTLPVPQLRLACATIHFIIENEQLSQFDEAIKLVQQVNQAVPLLLICQKTYMRLLTGLKIKALFQQIQKDSDRALVKLNAYFPRSTLKSKNSNKGQTFNQNYKNFRCFFFSLVSNENQLRAYIKDDYNAEFGPEFMKSMKKLCGRFLHQIESNLLPPMIEKVLACTECEKFSNMSPATEMLLDYVQEKKLSSQSDPNQQHSQETEHRASLGFTEQELFEMLTVSCPLYTQDWLPRDHGLDLSSPELFDSLGNQHYSQINSPYLIVSDTQDPHSLVPLAESQDQQLRQQPTPQEGSTGNQSQECLQQLQQVSLVSQEELPVAHRAPSLEHAGQHSAIVQCAVRRPQLTPEDNQLIRRPAVIEDDGQSKFGTETVQVERIDEEMEHSGLQPTTVNQLQVRERRVRPMTRSRCQITHGESQPSKKKPKTSIHRSQRTQDEVEPLQTELIVTRTSQMPEQDNVPTQIPTKQKTVQETLLSRSGISERTLSPLPEILQDNQQELVPTTSPQV